MFETKRVNYIYAYVLRSAKDLKGGVFDDNSEIIFFVSP